MSRIDQDKLCQRYNLKYNPFKSDIPVIGLYKSPQTSNFIDRIDDLVMDGGFACITGEPGLGKSSIMRQISSRLKEIAEFSVVEMTRPQSSIADIYRELTDIYSLNSTHFNRFQDFKQLRAKWKSHINTTLFRSVLLIDEAQYLKTPVLDELRIMVGDDFDSKKILTIVFSGDNRFNEKLEEEALQPLRSRISVRINLNAMMPDELFNMSETLLRNAGNSALIDTKVLETVANASAGIPRAMVHSLDQLLQLAYRSDATKVDSHILFKFQNIQEGIYDA
jgi:general secretion pathway protein A